MPPPPPFSVYGSGYSRGSSGNRAFQRQPLERLAVMPAGADILVTHGPLPSGALAALAPRLHVSGHIHCHHGVKQLQQSGGGGGGTVCINASIMDGRYRPMHAPIVIDMPHSAQDE